MPAPLWDSGLGTEPTIALRASVTLRPSMLSGVQQLRIDFQTNETHPQGAGRRETENPGRLGNKVKHTFFLKLRGRHDQAFPPTGWPVKSSDFLWAT